ncbi:hypothetical protein MtrunA17_Chr7g0240941 [Medicago truncatula]|uniref:Uncharacterized protein n=1 Tax=Medicago truncatula TaxID=3880 RepID=A0A396GYV3_MEDTR|nr:hypothetical protein MtrunA17_Chr7g0240941 [Medicago truncatula]
MKIKKGGYFFHFRAQLKIQHKTHSLSQTLQTVLQLKPLFINPTTHQPFHLLLSSSQITFTNHLSSPHSP